MSETRKSLLAVVEFLAHSGLKPLYERAGYAVTSEFSVRKAIAAVRKAKPDVVCADFFFQPDFRDRVSNLESLLAALQGGAGTKIMVYYDPAHQHALDKVMQRFQIDAALTIPLKQDQVEARLRAWSQA
jgi:ABC-type cobalt transport system substrate-binding protein